MFKIHLLTLYILITGQRSSLRQEMVQGTQMKGEDPERTPQLCSHDLCSTQDLDTPIPKQVPTQSYQHCQLLHWCGGKIKVVDGRKHSRQKQKDNYFLKHAIYTMEKTILLTKHYHNLWECRKYILCWNTENRHTYYL